MDTVDQPEHPERPGRPERPGQGHQPPAPPEGRPQGFGPAPQPYAAPGTPSAPPQQPYAQPPGPYAQPPQAQPPHPYAPPAAPQAQPQQPYAPQPYAPQPYPQAPMPQAAPGVPPQGQAHGHGQGPEFLAVDRHNSIVIDASGVAFEDHGISIEFTWPEIRSVHYKASPNGKSLMVAVIHLDGNFFECAVEAKPRTRLHEWFAHLAHVLGYYRPMG